MRTISAMTVFGISKLQRVIQLIAGQLSTKIFNITDFASCGYECLINALYVLSKSNRRGSLGLAVALLVVLILAGWQVQAFRTVITINQRIAHGTLK